MTGLRTRPAPAWSRRAETPLPIPAAAPSVRPMAALIKTVTFDCADALAQARFWAGALGSDVDEESTSARAYVEAAG